MSEDRTRHATAPPRSFGTLSLTGFVALGLPDGMWGTAWPAIRRTFDEPVGDLGLLLLAVTAGALVTSLATATVLRRLGAAIALAGAAGTGAGAAALLWTAAGWWSVVAAAVLFGAAAGVLDTGLNVLIATTGRPRLLNLLHGAYGVGTAIGPLVVTAAVLVGSWRPAYAVLLALELALALGWWATRSGWTGEVEATPAGGLAPPPRPSAAGRRRFVVPLGIWVFFCYTGFEVTTGQWAATYLRGPVRMSAGEAGAVVFLYWGALTAARFAVATPRRSPEPSALVRFGCLLGLAGALLIWWDPSRAVLVVGFGVVGAALAPVYPALVALTPHRVGSDHAHRVIAWQVAAAGVGGAAVSALAGLVLQRAGLTAYGPYLVAAGGLVLASALALEWVTREPGRPEGSCRER